MRNNGTPGLKGFQPTHGLSGTPEHNTWQRVISRCLNPNNSRFHQYGGRGIKVCAQWLESFQVFLADMGPKPSPSHSIERCDNDGNYEPSNCCWAIPLEQMNNTSRNVRLEYNGEVKTVSQWAREAGLSDHVFRTRILRGWSVAEALTLDLKKNPWKRSRTKKVYPACAVKDCDRKAAGRGVLCARHAHARRHGTALTAEIIYGRAKLTRVSIPLIRAAVQSKETATEIAKRFNVSATTIREITRGKTWKNV
jgi:hypothetical protein